MKSNNARATLTLAFCFYVFLGLILAVQGQADEYYIYRDSAGGLVISNKEPPPGSKIIKQQNLPEITENQVQPPEERADMPLNGQAEGSAKPSKK